jgi:hypothetical protein
MLKKRTVAIAFTALFILAGYSAKRDCPKREVVGDFIIQTDRDCVPISIEEIKK